MSSSSQAINNMPSAVICRTATREDASQIAAILTQAFSGLLSSLFATTDRAVLTKLMTATIENGSIRPETLIVAEWNGDIVGAAILQDGRPITGGTLQGFYRAVRNSCGSWRAALSVSGALTYRLFDSRSPFYPHLLYIEAIAVAEEQRGCGIGTSLLMAAEQHASELGKTHLGLHVIRSRKRARELYIKQGYTRVLRIPVAPLHTFLFRWLGSRDVWYMEKPVTQKPVKPTLTAP